MCCNDNTVYEVLGKTPTKQFTTVSLPCSLCVTTDNTIVAGTSDNSVIVYNTTGQVLYTTQASGSNLVVGPLSITVCTSTGDIPVCGIDRTLCGGKGKPCVSVFNSKLVLKYNFYGPPESQHRHVMTKRFYPQDVVYDSQGQLLIAEYKCIHLVSGEGQFLAVVYTDILQPIALTLIQDGLLRVVFDRTIKVIQYRV